MEHRQVSVYLRDKEIQLLDAVGRKLENAMPGMFVRGNKVNRTAVIRWLLRKENRK